MKGRHVTQQTSIFSRSFEHDEALFNAAIDEFVDKGYENASINTILATAGMSKGQFYYHFGNKEGLYLAIVGVLIERKQAFMQQAMQPDDFQQDIFTIFRRQFRYGLAFAREHPAIDRFARSFVREKGNPIYERVLAVHNFTDNALLDRLIDTACERGEFRADLPRDFVRGIVGYLFTHAVEILDAGQTTDMEAGMDHLIDVIQFGIANHSTQMQGGPRP